MVIHCPNCGQQIINEQLNKDNGTSIPIRCECKANGFVTFMLVEDNKNIITVQTIRTIK